jgi:hypothetical protein
MRPPLVLGLLLFASSALAGAPASSSCDRECLRGLATQVLHALVEHDVGQLPVTGSLRVTEDAVEKPLAQVGLVRSVTKLRGYRQDVIDERAGQVVTGAMVEEGGAPVILVVRLKTDGDRISELELVTTRGRADGMLFVVDNMNAPTRAMNIAPKPSQLHSREEAIRIAMHYPRGLNSAESFAAVGTPFSKDAFRFENGSLMAGPGCTFAPGCNDIANQSLAVFKRLGRVTLRDIYVDERMGIVMMRLSWNARGPGSDKLTAFEMFKVYDGQIHAVEAWIRLFPPEQELGGWPIAVAQPED